MELSDEEIERLSPAVDNPDSDEDRGIRSDEAEEESGARGKDDADDEEESKRRVDPSTSKKRIIKNPQPKLNMERIQGPKGVQTIEKYFEGFKFHGKGHEKSDLDRVMKRLEHWAHRLFPKYCFDDFIEKMESLGVKKNVQVYLKKYRLDMITADDDVVDGAVEDDAERGEEGVEKHPVDEFDKLIAEQIEKQRASEEIVPVSVTPAGNVLGSAGATKSTELSDEIRARIEANKKLALERKMARTRRLEEEKKRASEEATRSVSAAITVESQNPEFSVEETLEESERRTNKRQKLENSPELRRAPFPVGDDNSDREISVEKCHDTPNAAVSENLESIRVRGSEELPEEMEETKRNGKIEETVEISTKAAEIEETPRKEEETSSTQSRRESSTATADDSERLLTPEELLMAIDGAMEEIICRKN